MSTNSRRRAYGVPRILVIEDVETTRRRMCAALRAAGYQVDEARNGVEGLRLLSSEGNHYDAILLDLLLPELDGWRVREVQLRHPQLSTIPTVIVTVRPLREPDRYVLRAQTVIQKPFEDGELIASVADACAVGSQRSKASRAWHKPDPAARATGELFWSRRGEVACREHVPDATSERWTSERWAPIPRGAGRDRLIYQCQYCSGRGPIHHRSMVAAQ